MTIFVIVALVVLALVYDLIAFLRGGFQNTISWAMYELGKSYPIIPFLLGVVAGHFFWSQVC